MQQKTPDYLLLGVCLKLIIPQPLHTKYAM